MNLKNLKSKIQGFINSYVNSGLKDIIENSIISCAAKMIYKNVNRIVKIALSALLILRSKFDEETNPDKKEKKLIGLRLGGECLKQIGQALLSASDTLLKGLE